MLSSGDINAECDYQHSKPQFSDVLDIHLFGVICLSWHLARVQFWEVWLPSEQLHVRRQSELFQQIRAAL